MILYVNACIREEASRTDKLARVLLARLGEYKEVKLTNELVLPLDKEMLAWRSLQADRNDFGASYFDLAKDFMQADTIVVAAPFWDGAFPAILKTYLENIYIIGLNTAYDETGLPVGLCKAEKCYYVTTSGGPYFPDFGYNYLEYLMKRIFGIKDTVLYYAEMLDVVGNDCEKIMAEAIEVIKNGC